MYKRSRTDNFWGDYCNLSYCFTAVVLEVNSVWSCERRVHAGIHASSVRYLLVDHVNHECIKGRVLCFSQPNSLTPSKFNTYFTTNYVPSIWKYLANIYFIADPVTRVYQILFTSSQTISMKNLNGKQKQLPREILSFDRYSLRGVYWIISCSSLVLLCFLGGDTLNESRWDSAVGNIVWPQRMTRRWYYPPLFRLDEIKLANN